MKKLIVILLLLCLSVSSALGQQKLMLGQQIDFTKAAGLVGYWPMNEGSGNIVRDLTGNGGVGTVSVFTWGSSPHGPALITYVNSTQQITLPTTYTPIDGTSSFTVIADVSIEIMGDDRAIFCTSSWGQGFMLWGDDAVSDKFAVYMDTSAGATGSLFGSTTIALNTWYHVAVTYDGVTVRMYVNGNEEGGSFPFAHTGVLDATANNYRFGNSPALNRDFRGNINYIYLYNRVLSAKDIHQRFVNPYYFTAQSKAGLWGNLGGAGVNIFRRRIDN